MTRINCIEALKRLYGLMDIQRRDKNGYGRGIR